MANLANWGGARPPAKVVLDGRYARLEPLDKARHADNLREAALAPGAEERFRYLFESADADYFRSWIERATSSSDPLFFGVINKATGRVEGRQSLMRIDRTNDVIEIGSILWGPTIARSPWRPRRFTSSPVMFSGTLATVDSSGSAMIATNHRNGPPNASAFPTRTFSTAYGRQGRESRHCLVRDDRCRVVAHGKDLRGLATAREFRRGGLPTHEAANSLNRTHPSGNVYGRIVSGFAPSLRGSAEQRQVENVRYALQHNMGLGGACVVTLYEKAA